MALFPSLSTRSLPTALVAHAQSCCPTMDVAVLSNPTNAPGNCSIQLYRLSGGSNAPVTPSVTSESTHSSSKVWETTREDKAAVIDGPLAAKHAGATNTAAAPLTYIQPRAPETLQWQPDGRFRCLGCCSFRLLLNIMIRIFRYRLRIRVNWR